MRDVDQHVKETAERIAFRDMSKYDSPHYIAHSNAIDEAMMIEGVDFDPRTTRIKMIRLRDETITIGYMVAGSRTCLRIIATAAIIMVLELGYLCFRAHAGL